MTKEPRNRLAYFRKEKGLSQQQLAEAIDAHWVTLSKLENGKVRLTYEWARRIADVLKVDIYDIFSPEAEYKYIDIFGQIQDRGLVKFNPPGHTLRMDMEYYQDKNARWFEIETDEFFPLIRRNDFVKLAAIEPHEVDRCRGRLCLVENAQDAEDVRMGILGNSIPDGGDELLRANGSLIKSIEFFHILGCVTMALFAPGRLGEIRLETTKAPDEKT